MHRYIVLTCMAVLVFATGCRAPQTVKNAWKDTRSYYRAYLNTPATLNLEDKGDCEEYQVALGAAVSEFDFQLQELERVLQNSDRNPDPVWVGKMTKRFPWLSGLALTDDIGEPKAQVPADYPKPFEATSLAKVDTKQHLKDLRAFVQEDPLGPEIYIGNPVYAGSDFRGVIVAHFDPRVLIARTADPGKFMLASPQGIIWPGLYEAESTPIAAIEWGEVVKDRSYGTVSNANGTFYWVARYVGNLPLIYAVKVKGDFPKNTENLSALVTANSFALGAVTIAGAENSSPVPQPPRMPQEDTVPVLQPRSMDRGAPARQARDDDHSGMEGDVGNIGKPNVAPNAPVAGAVVPKPQTPAANPLQE